MSMQYRGSEMQYKCIKVGSFRFADFCRFIEGKCSCLKIYNTKQRARLSLSHLSKSGEIRKCQEGKLQNRNFSSVQCTATPAPRPPGLLPLPPPPTYKHRSRGG